MANESIEELLTLKDKSAANNEKKNAFEANWLSYVDENGYDETAELYLYRGFQFRKMHPYMSLIVNSPNKIEVITQFIKGSQFHESRNARNRFMMIINLLAISIVRMPEENEVIAFLIRTLTEVSKDKKGKLFYKTGTIISEYFLSEISQEVNFPSWSALSLKPAFQKEFAGIINAGLDEYTHGEILSPSKDALVKKVRIWVNYTDMSAETAAPVALADKNNTDSGLSATPADIPQETVLRTERENDILGQEYTGKPDSEEQNQPFVVQPDTLADVETSVDPKSSDSNTDCQSSTGREQSTKNGRPRQEYHTQKSSGGSDWRQPYTFLGDFISRIERENRQYVIRNDELVREQVAAKAEIHQLQSKINRFEMEMEKLQVEIGNQYSTISGLEKQVVRQNEIITAKDSEIEDRIRHAEIISMDKSKQSDAVLKRLSSELASYYEDFVSASGEDMTVEIGEILRDQLTEIYSILKKAGIEL